MSTARSPVRGRHVLLAVVLLALLLAAPPSRPPQLPAPPSQRAPVPGSPVRPGTAVTPPADPRSAAAFIEWRLSHQQSVQAFEAFLEREQMAGVVPIHQLLRSASMWRECGAEPFQVPPRHAWPEVRSVLALLAELRRLQVLAPFEVVSAYRDPALNRCAGGAPGSSHTLFAVDLLPRDAADGARLCRFWRDQGRAWNMGVSQYPSGRIHIDRNGYRTWGASHKNGSSFCL